MRQVAAGLAAITVGLLFLAYSQWQDARNARTYAREVVEELRACSEHRIRWARGVRALATWHPSECGVAAIELLDWVELICRAPRIPSPTKGECRLFEARAQAVTEQILAAMEAACR